MPISGQGRPRLSTGLFARSWAHKAARCVLGEVNLLSPLQPAAGCLQQNARQLRGVAPQRVHMIAPLLPENPYAGPQACEPLPERCLSRLYMLSAWVWFNRTVGEHASTAWALVGGNAVGRLRPVISQVQDHRAWQVDRASHGQDRGRLARRVFLRVA